MWIKLVSILTIFINSSIRHEKNLLHIFNQVIYSISSFIKLMLCIKDVS